MKKVVLLMFYCFAAFFVSAQPNIQEAKAAYLLAEEEFNNGKYETAIHYLNQAIEKLGGANAKILYLKILALKELAPASDNYFEQFREALEAFDKVPDHATFNEEKVMEVAKLKLKLASDPSAFGALTQQEKNALDVLGMQGWRLGARIEDMIKKFPDFFSNAKSSSYAQNVQTYYLQPSDKTKMSQSVEVKDGKIVTIYGSLPIFFKDDAQFSTAHKLKSQLTGSVASTFTEKVVYSMNSFLRKELDWQNQRIKIHARIDNTSMVYGKRKNAYTSYETSFFLRISLISQ